MAASLHRQRWITFDPINGDLSDYLTEWKPSQTFAPDIEWICVSRKKVGSKLITSDTVGLMSAWKALCASKTNMVNAEDVQCLAAEYNVLSGKWMLFILPKAVDEAWSIIATAVIQGQLGDDAKVSSSHEKLIKKKAKKERKEGSDYSDFLKLQAKKEGGEGPDGCHVICVYANDFNDVEQIFSMRESLGRLGFNAKISFKPDAYSFCGVYSGNIWGIPPTIYAA